jgi:hypothetical protein
VAVLYLNINLFKRWYGIRLAATRKELNSSISPVKTNSFCQASIEECKRSLFQRLIKMAWINFKNHTLKKEKKRKSKPVYKIQRHINIHVIYKNTLSRLFTKTHIALVLQHTCAYQDHK